MGRHDGETRDTGRGTRDLGLGTWDMGHGTWDLGLGLGVRNEVG